jgi:hypothetical protein
MVNEFAYCPRLFFYECVEGQLRFAGQEHSESMRMFLDAPCLTEFTARRRRIAGSKFRRGCGRPDAAAVGP